MNKLTQDHFSFKCPMSWDEMKISENGRFCNKCRKEVFDLTNCSIDEVIALQRKHGPICGSIRVAAVAVSLSAAACHNPTATRTTGIAPPHPSGDQPVERLSISGTPLPPPVLGKMKQIEAP